MIGLHDLIDQLAAERAFEWRRCRVSAGFLRGLDAIALAVLKQKNKTLV